jgi:hypothetical protein
LNTPITHLIGALRIITSKRETMSALGQKQT